MCSQKLINLLIYKSCFDWIPSNYYLTMGSMMPAFFFSMAVILNLGNWMNYYLKIGDQASLAHDNFKQTNKKAIKRCIQIFTLLLSISLPGYCILIIVFSMRDTKYEKHSLFLVFGYFFICIGILFGVASLVINLRIKKYFPGFYFENRTILILVSVFLSIPIIFRGVIDISRAYSETFEKWVLTHEEYFTPAFYILGDLIPLCFQLSTLVFGYIRYKKNKK